MTALWSAFSAIDHHQDGAIGIEPTLNQVSQQRLAGTRYSRSLLPATLRRACGSVALDADRCQHYVVGEVHPVDHHGDQRQGQ